MELLTRFVPSCDEWSSRKVCSNCKEKPSQPAYKRRRAQIEFIQILNAKPKNAKHYYPEQLSELMFQRNIRTKIDLVRKNIGQKVAEKKTQNQNLPLKSSEIKSNISTKWYFWNYDCEESGFTLFGFNQPEN